MAKRPRQADQPKSGNQCPSSLRQGSARAMGSPWRRTARPELCEKSPAAERRSSALLEALEEKNLTLALGPAGTGKTYLGDFGGRRSAR